MDTITSVIDDLRREYLIDRKIGEGGQGETYLVKGQPYIVKLYRATQNETIIKSRINFLIQTNLDNRMFAIPERVVTMPRLGYISRYAKGMIPLTDILLPPTNVHNRQIWLQETGGMEKRYEVLFKLATALRVLHGRGLSYCDLSPANVFVASNPAGSSVTLIDLDNLRIKSSIRQNIFTPRYGAPEVVRGEAPNSIASDMFSFAVIAYEMLTWAHPLIGDYVDESEPEVEDKALRGELPWVEHSTDDMNHRSSGLPTELFCSEKIKELFCRTFESGLNMPMSRPTAGEWYDALLDAKNRMIRCLKCGTTVPYQHGAKCPFCDQEYSRVTRVQFRHVSHVQRVEDGVSHSILSLSPVVSEELFVNRESPKSVYGRSFGLNIDDFYSEVLNLSVLDEQTTEKLVFVPNQGTQLLYTDETSQDRKLPSKRAKTACRSFDEKRMFHLKPIEEDQIIMLFGY